MYYALHGACREKAYPRCLETRLEKGFRQSSVTLLSLLSYHKGPKYQQRTVFIWLLSWKHNDGFGKYLLGGCLDSSG